MLARFRPTPLQGMARGVATGALAGAASLVLVAVTHLALGGARWWVPVAAFSLPLLGGAALGPSLARDCGADADDLGIHRAPASPPSFSPWRGIVDIRAERRGPRLVVAVYLDTGVVHRLPAPYDGRLLARDPDFERKLFTLRNLWETHRSWNLPPDRWR